MNRLFFIRLSLMLAVFLFLPASASDNLSYASMRAEIDEMFRYVDLNDVPTGILSDYGVGLVSPDDFDGALTDVNYMDYTLWRLLYKQLYNSQVNSRSQLELPTTVFDNLASGIGNVAIMRYSYNAFDTLALKDGRLTFDGKHVRLVAGMPSPYLEKECFAVTPLSNAQDTLIFQPENLQK